MVRLEDYIPLEEGVADWLFSLWQDKADAILKDATKALDRDDYDEAVRLVRGLDVQSIAKAARSGLENHVVASLTFGAMVASGSSKILYADEKLPPVIGPVVGMYLRTIEEMPEKVAQSLLRLVTVAKGEISDAEDLSDHSGHHHTNVVLEKAQKLTNAQKLNAVVMGRAKSALDVAANLNTSRLVSLGFLEQQLSMGIDVYQHTAVLDGRVCGVCQTLHGKTFSTATAHAQVLRILTQTDPEAVKLMAPFASQSKAAIAEMRTMTPSALQSAGLAHVPVHPGCRCRQVKVGTVPVAQTLPVGPVTPAVLPDVPLPSEAQLASLAAKELSPTMKGAAPALRKQLSDTEIEALDKLFTEPTVNQWTRTCWGKALVQKAESDFSFCSAFDPKKMGKLVTAADKGVKAWELDADFGGYRMASGAFAKELLDNWESLLGSVIHDKGFTLWNNKIKAQADNPDFVKIYVKASKGQKAVKVGDTYAFPKNAKFQVYAQKFDKDWNPTLYVKLLDDDLPSAPLAGAGKTVGEVDVPKWFLDEGFDEDLYADLHVTQGKSHKQIWDENQQYLADNDYDHVVKPYPGDSVVFTPKATSTLTDPDVVPAGTKAKEDLKFKLGDDYLDHADLTYHSAKPGGSIPGEVMTDQTGQKWIVKHVSNEEIARNEVLSGKFYEAMGVEVPELRLVNGPNGEVWVASKWVDDFVTDAAKLQSKERIAGLYDNFVVDAYMSNWDVVGMDYDNIGLRMGRAYRIDIGGALRFRAQGGLKSEEMFPNTVVDLDNMRNPDISPKVAKVFADITESELRAGALKVANLTDEAIEKMIRQYGPVKFADQDALILKMQQRRDDIAKRFPKATSQPVLNTVQEAPKTKGRITDQEYREIVESRTNGKAIKADLGDIEEQQILTHIEYDTDGSPITVMTMKLRGEAGDRVLAMAQKGSGPEESLADSLVAAIQKADADFVTWIKGYKTQITGNGVLRKEEFDRYSAAIKSFRAFDDEMRSMVDALPAPLRRAAEDHIYSLRLVMDRHMMGKKVGDKAVWVGEDKLFSKMDLTELQALKKQTPKNEAIPFDFKSDTYLRYPLKEFKRGKAVRTGKDNTLAALTYKATDGDIELMFNGTNAEQYALQNRLSIAIKGEGPAAIEKGFKALDRLGVKNYRPDPMEEDFVYFMRVANLNKETAKRARELELDDALPLSIKVEELRDDIKLTYGLDDATLDRHKAAKSQAFAQDFDYYERPDLDPQEWDRFAAGHRLYHDPTYGGGMNSDELVDLLLETGGRVAPTLDKIRRGIRMNGASPEADLNSGGGGYFFTRIQSSTSHTLYRQNAMVFKPDALKRLSTVSYDGDNYGRVGPHNTRGQRDGRDDFLYDNRKVTIQEWERTARIGGNETIIKGGLSLFDSLDYVVVADHVRDNLIRKIKTHHKLSVWPDGRAVEDVILTKKMAEDRVMGVKPAPAPPKPVPMPSWAKSNPELWNKGKAMGLTDGEIKDTFDNSGLTPQAKVATGDNVPDWASKDPAYYKYLLSEGFDNEHIMASFKAENLYVTKPVVDPKPPSMNTTVKVKGDDLEWDLPNGMPAWSHGYSEYYLKWEAEGMSLDQIKTKIAAYKKDSFIYPDWVKSSWSSQTKELYKQMKKFDGLNDMEIQHALHKKGLTSPPPIAPPKYPEWASGYEHLYDKWEPQLSKAELQKKLVSYAKDAYIYPNWLNKVYKAEYQKLKKDGWADGDIKAHKKEWVE